MKVDYVRAAKDVIWFDLRMSILIEGVSSIGNWVSLLLCKLMVIRCGKDCSEKHYFMSSITLFWKCIRLMLVDLILGIFVNLLLSACT